MKQFTNSVKFVSAAGVLLAHFACAEQQEEFVDTLKAFAQWDERQLARTRNPALSNGVGFKASFVVTRFRTDIEQGAEIRSSTVAWTNGCCVMRTHIAYEHPPIYRSVGSPEYPRLSYDRDGNLIVWRAAEEYTVYAPDRNDNLTKYQMYRVSNEGRILDTKSYAILTRYSVGNLNNLALFEQFRMVTGRGFASQLQVVTCETPTEVSSGRFALEALGSYGSGLRGTWKLSYEKQLGNLIREAAFTAEVTGQPTLQVLNAGEVSCPGLVLAESGTFASGWHRGRFHNEAQYQLLNLKGIIRSEFASFFDQVLDQFGLPLPKGQSEIVDRRTWPPTRTPVEEHRFR